MKKTRTGQSRNEVRRRIRLPDRRRWVRRVRALVPPERGSDNKVCLLEARPRDAWWNWKIHMPAALMYNLMDDRYNWDVPHRAAALHERPRHDGRAGACWAAPPRSTPWSMSAAMRWTTTAGPSRRIARAGLPEILPYFRRAEHRKKGGDAYRGDGGPPGSIPATSTTPCLTLSSRPRNRPAMPPPKT